MPIDPSIPLQVQPIKIESPGNQLAMMGEAMKLGEMQRGVETQNKLRELYSQGVDVSTPEGFKQLASIDPVTAMKLRTQGLETRKLEGEIKKTGFDLTEKGMNIMRERSKDLLQNPSNENYIAHMQEGVRDGLVSPEQAQRSVQTFTAIPPNQRVGYITQGLAKAEKVYETNVISAAQQQTNATTLRGQNLTDARAREMLNKLQYMQTDAGLVALPNVLKPGQAPVVTMVTGPNGENLGRPLKEIPATVNKAITENEIALNKVKRAIDLNAGKEITLPSGDKIQGDADATGFFKGMLPQVILNSWDPKGVSTRAFIADIGSLKVHDRSGAAVTASETPRLKPFIPSILDSAEVAATKLANFKAEYEDIQNSFAETYSREQGYRPNPTISGGAKSGGNKPSLNDIFNPKQ